MVRGISYRMAATSVPDRPPRADKERSHRGYGGAEAPRHLADAARSALMQDERDALPLR
jgi:hypothetical protein